MPRKYKMLIYPPTSVVVGNETADEYIERMADALYDEWVCDHRFDPEDLKELIDIAVSRRNNPK